MWKYLQKSAEVAVALTLAGPMTWPASAHAIIVSATPTADAHVPAGKLTVRMEFNSRIDKARSRLQVTARSGVKADVPIDTAGKPNIVTGTTGLLAAGAYVLRWQVLAIDGHITRGDIPFTVDH
jgi:methionine-rich copper-binding protein CopC